MSEATTVDGAAKLAHNSPFADGAAEVLVDEAVDLGRWGVRSYRSGGTYKGSCGSEVPLMLIKLWQGQDAFMRRSARGDGLKTAAAVVDLGVPRTVARTLRARFCLT